MNGLSLEILDDDHHPHRMIAIIWSLMGHSRDDKAKNHDRIVEIAAARIRESGTQTPGVAEIMQAAGLTHGGFYKHFSSRDDLVAEAADRTFADGERAIEAVTAGAEDPLAAFVDWYASADHRDNPATGCGVVALGADASRGDERVRAAYREQVERYLAHLEQLLGGDEDARRRATVALSSLVGAVLVARAIGDDPLSDEILRDVRAAVTSLPPTSSPARSQRRQARST
jgi:TetR/AcrR family transcriptional repressor of nem operon